MSAIPMSEASPGTAPLRFSWVPPPGSFLALSLFNGVLRILTLGVYHFWGKTEVRQRIWSAVRIDGEPLEYRGTGGELFRGFLIVFALVLLPLLIAGFLAAIFLRSPTGSGSYNLLFWVVLFLLSGFGIHRARRYRLSRTRWRGIRAGLSGRSSYFAWTYLWTTALVPLTLGWILPWRAVRLQSLLFNDTRFGDKTFRFTGRAGPLYRRFWLMWLSAFLLLFVASGAIGFATAANMPRPNVPMPMQRLTGAQVASIVGIVFAALFVFAMIRGWYSTRMLNYFASQTTLEGAAFKLEARTGSLVWLTASNYLMRVASFGLLTPVTEARSIRYIVERISIDRAVPLEAIGQNPDVLLRRGEGLAEAFDVDAF